MKPLSPPTPATPFPLPLVDREIEHIRRVMPQSLAGDLAGPILPASYWRQRLNQLLDAGHISEGQRGEIDGLLLRLDEFEREAARRE